MTAVPLCRACGGNGQDVSGLPCPLCQGVGIEPGMRVEVMTKAESIEDIKHMKPGDRVYVDADDGKMPYRLGVPSAEPRAVEWDEVDTEKLVMKRLYEAHMNGGIGRRLPDGRYEVVHPDGEVVGVLPYVEATEQAITPMGERFEPGCWDLSARPSAKVMTVYRDVTDSERYEMRVGAAVLELLTQYSSAVFLSAPHRPTVMLYGHPDAPGGTKPQVELDCHGRRLADVLEQHLAGIPDPERPQTKSKKNKRSLARRTNKGGK